MKKKVFLAIILATVSSLATVTCAASASWQKTRLGYTIYGPNFWNSTPFSDLNVPINNSSITNVSWIWHPIQNGDTTIVELCYHRPYHTNSTLCTDITPNQTDSTDYFNGEDARGQFYMKFKTVGNSGTYPVYSTSRTPDTLTVNYKLLNN